MCLLILHLFYLCLVFVRFIFERQREAEHEQRRGREGKTQNLKQAPSSELSVQRAQCGA